MIRRSEGLGPFPSKPNLVDKPVLNEIVPPDLRRPRARMIALVDGYFSTLQLNDGVLFTQFDDNCNRIENGLLTTHNPDLMKTIPVANLGCARNSNSAITATTTASAIAGFSSLTKSAAS